MDKYDVIGEIGKGCFGTVSKIIRRSDKKILIWKELKYEGIPEKEKELILNEINILKEMNHPNIVKQYEIINDFINYKLYIVMEYCEGGDLDKLILKNKFNKRLVDEKLIRDILIQTLSALNYIHNEKKILHRDIKPSNIFLDKDFNIKLGDFGLSKKFYNEYSNTIIGTPLYMSPELLERKPYNEKADIWALGCSIYELATFSTPYEAPSMNILLNKIRNGLPQRINSSYSNELWNMISKMLTYDYNKRPSSLELINEYDEFFSLKNNINNDRNDIIKKYKELYLYYKQKAEKMESRQKEQEKIMKNKEDFINKRDKEQNIKEEKLNKKEIELEKKERELKEKERALNEIKNKINKYINQNNYLNDGNDNNNLLNIIHSKEDNNNIYEYNNNDKDISNEENKGELMNTNQKLKECLNREKGDNHNKNNLNDDYNALDLINDDNNTNDKKEQNNECNNNNNIYTNTNVKEEIKTNNNYYSNNNQNKDDIKLNYNYNNNDENVLEPTNNDINHENIYNQNLINQNYQNENNENKNKINSNNYPNFGNNEKININEIQKDKLGTTFEAINDCFDLNKNQKDNSQNINKKVNNKNNNNNNISNNNDNNNRNNNNNNNNINNSRNNNDNYNNNNNNVNNNNKNNNNNINKNNSNNTVNYNNNNNINHENKPSNNANYLNKNYQQNEISEEDQIQYLYYKNKKIFPKIGLKNKGNISYLNAILNILGNNEELALYFLNPDKISFFDNTKDMMPISYEMKKFFQNYYPNKIDNNNNYDPYSLLLKVKGRKGYRTNILKNPNNLLKALFSNLNFELNPDYKDKEVIIIKKFELKNSINDSIILFDERYKSPIFDIFSFYKINESKCNHCNSSYMYLKYSFTFKLNISECYYSFKNEKHKITIEDCLNFNSQNPKIDNKYPCEKCKNKKKIISKIYRSPNIFLFLLDRGNNFDINKNKLLKIPFLIEGKLDLQKYIKKENSPTKYELVGIVSISLSDNKYVANCKSPIDNNWYYFNDLKVQAIDYNIVINTNNNNNYYVPCILVYKSIKN